MKNKAKKENRQNCDFDPYKESVYEQFVEWYALPTSERHQLGASTFSEFAKKYAVHRNTLTKWKNSPNFRDKVYKLRQSWGDDMTSVVFEGWKIACMKGNPKAIELWLAYFFGFDRGKTEFVDKTRECVSADDIENLILELPEEDRAEHYLALSKLAKDVRSFREQEGKNNSAGLKRFLKDNNE